MSTDYYLKHTYSNILNNNRHKSKYKTLSESYSSVYESDETTDFIPSKVNELMLDLQRWNDLQKSLYRLTATKTTQQEFSPSEIESNAEAEADLVAAKNGIPTGLGPGEYAVASVISGSYNPKELVNLISGQSMTYDISWPSSDPGLAKYKFEVKLEGDVRIGAEGADLGNHVKEVLKNVLQQIHEEYTLLKGEERKTADSEILKRIKLRELKEPEVETYARRGKSKTTSWEKDQEKPGSIKKRKKHEAELSKRSGWTVEGYIHSILSNLNELPVALINGTEYEYANKNPKTKSELSRNQYLITPLLSFLQAIDSFHGSVNTGRWDKEEVDTRSVSAIKNVLHRYYGVKDTEKASEINKVIDSEAHKVDRKLSRTKHTVTGEGIASYSDFFKAVKKLHLTKVIEELGKYMTSGEALRDCFPDDLTGLFVVNPEGYRYVPESKIGDNIKLVSISLGKPKIELKEPGE